MRPHIKYEDIIYDQVAPFQQKIVFSVYRSSHPEALLEKGVLKLCSKFTEEHPCQKLISIKLLCNLKSHFDMGVLL